jgi:hypothetical protein
MITNFCMEDFEEQGLDEANETSLLVSLLVCYHCDVADCVQKLELFLLDVYV